MKKIFYLMLILFIFSLTSASYAIRFKEESYKPVDTQALKLQLKDFKNDKVVYSGTFKKTLATFPPYVVRSGVKTGKYYYLQISPSAVPVIVKRDKEIDELVLKLTKGSTVKVFGKIKKFRHEPNQTLSPYYYLELVKLEIIKLGNKDYKENDDVVPWKNKKDKNSKKALKRKIKKLKKLQKFSIPKPPQ